ncbi:MAG TPA: neutral/alkaline non-lysosomal ceramidase N-terminal domain-containing protein [Longimicrobiaceae bacterium]|nr:neutral/alkaline non-lysosomal ceramidase N-terminal domain-containing protein [Longimicrobiaceae bacterium]
MPIRVSFLRRRKFLLLVAGAGGLTTAGISLAPRALDDEIGTDLLAERDRVVAAAAAELTSDPGSRPLRAGWAALPLPLPEGVPLAGYGARRGASSTGIHDPLFARVICLETDAHRALVICQDLLLANPALAADIGTRLARELRARPTTILFTATHTHSGPGGWGEMFLEESVTGAYDRELFRDLAEATAETARHAMANAASASIGFLSLEAPDLLENRTVKGGPVDASLEVVVLKATENPAGVGATALLILFGAHATCLPSGNLLLSGDYPGALVNSLENEETIDFAAFAAGVVGSHAPSPPVPGGFDGAASLGNTLAARVLEALPDAVLSPSISLGGSTFVAPMPPLQFRVSEGRRLPAWVGGLLHPSEGRFSGLLLNDRLWIGMPVELSGILSPDLRGRAAAHELALTLTCFNGDYLGYVIPDDLYEDAALYEARMNFLGPRGGSFITDLLAGLVDEVARMRRQVPRESQVETGNPR